MNWQNILFTTGAIVFAISLFPSILSKDKPALATSLLSGIMLMLFAIAYATLRFWTSALSNAVLSFLWLILAFQKHRGSNNE